MEQNTVDEVQTDQQDVRGPVAHAHVGPEDVEVEGGGQQATGA